MKAIFTLIIVLFFGAMAMAQNTESNGKMETTEMGVVLDSSISGTVFGFETSNSKQREVARLYKFKNSRIKKALTFTTKRNNAKMA